MSRYVILEHDYPEYHWDLMLEAGDVLRTWRLAEPPRPGAVVRAEVSLDHRPFYLDYEGPVSGNRGQVKRWDAGSFTWEVDDADQVVVHLSGRRCQGTAWLRRNADQQWQLALEE